MLSIGAPHSSKPQWKTYQSARCEQLIITEPAFSGGSASESLAGVCPLASYGFFDAV